MPKSSLFDHRPDRQTTTLVAVASLALLAYGWSRTQVRVPAGLTPIQEFDVSAYMGTWFELARIDHVFERGLVRGLAHYSLQDDGSVRVVNRGFNPKTGRWKRSEGHAEFVGDPSVAALKVSFFGPFYGGYNVVYLDDECALVIGSSPRYFWLLARNPRIAPAKRAALLEFAESLGVDTNRVIDVPQGA